MDSTYDDDQVTTYSELPEACGLLDIMQMWKRYAVTSMMNVFIS
jgi:hypothetical protein